MEHILYFNSIKYSRDLFSNNDNWNRNRGNCLAKKAT